MKALGAITAAAVLLGAAPAAAKALPDGGVAVEEVADVLQARGYEIEVTTDGVGDPLIFSRVDGSLFGVFFYGCEAPRCDSLQFATSFEAEGMTFQRINQWNTEQRFGRAYLDEEMDPFLEMDLDLIQGASTELIGAAVDLWAEIVPEFKAFIAD